ncbi:hypothetical protein [Actinoplanes rectilineatus]|uniref:hypothetical protein n=1 Tax=Actinoplanes rectilineatus TaxID=113571 RepID=UPI0005F2B1D2|nr:hypothetical protein [Actinoplanes rectilineatus]
MDHLWGLLAEAQQIEDLPVREELLKEITRRCDQEAAPEIAAGAFLGLTAMFVHAGRWKEGFGTFGAALALHDSQPARFTREQQDQLLFWYGHMVDDMIDFPDVPLERLEHLIADLEQRLADRGWPAVSQARRRLAQTVGDWPAEEAAFQRWLDTGGADEPDAATEPWRVERLVLRGDPVSLAGAFALTDPILAGEPAPRSVIAAMQCQVLLPLVAVGRHADAVEAYRWVMLAMANGVHRYETYALRMEFCALTGNADEAVGLLTVLDKFDRFERPAGRMHLATAITVLTAAYLRTGRGQYVVGQGDGEGTPMWMLHDRMRTICLDLAAQFDKRNGTTACGDRVRARLDREPLIGFLPLRPGAVAGDVSPPAGMSDADLLDRVRWHQARDEVAQARACLEAVREPAGPLGGHAAEMRARLHAATDTRETMHEAIARHRERGESTIALLAECWLGLRPDEPDGHALTTRAAESLRAGSDDEAAGWADLWYAYVLVRQGRFGEAVSTVRRGAERSRGHALAEGVLTRIEAAWHNQLGSDPVLTAHLAARAIDLFLEAGAGIRAIDAVNDLATAHARAGTDPEFRALVDDLLRRDLPSEVRGHLRHLRGRHLLDCGRAAEAVDDLYDAHGQLFARAEDHRDAALRLMQACAAAGRPREALEAGVLATQTPAESERDPARTNLLRFTMAESYLRIGWLGAALPEYETLVESLRRLGETRTRMYDSAATTLENLRVAVAEDRQHG